MSNELLEQRAIELANEIKAYREIREYIQSEQAALRAAEKSGAGWDQGKADALWTIEKQVKDLIYAREPHLYSIVSQLGKAMRDYDFYYSENTIIVQG